MTLKFKRQSPGHYVTATNYGELEIKKGIGADQDKWYVYFPDGKVSYRRSYEAAKAWCEKYLEKLGKQPVKASRSKNQKVVPTLLSKLQQSSAYVIGAEPIGCINSGKAACILHLLVNDRSYYIVGFDGAVTDTHFERITFRIKRDLQRGAFEEYYQTRWGEVSVFNNFKDAEKAYRLMDDRIRADNQAARKEIAEAKVKAAKGDIASAFVLGDYGIV